MLVRLAVVGACLAQLCLAADPPREFLPLMKPQAPYIKPKADPPIERAIQSVDCTGCKNTARRAIDEMANGIYQMRKELSETECDEHLSENRGMPKGYSEHCHAVLERPDVVRSLAHMMQFHVEDDVCSDYCKKGVHSAAQEEADMNDSIQGGIAVPEASPLTTQGSGS